jgi:regulator of replication initiation timing
MEISQLEIFAQVGQLYAENTILKRQVNELATENQQLKSQLHPPNVPSQVIDVVPPQAISV